MRGYRFPRKVIINGNGVGEDGKVLVWILTPTGATTPNSVHVWKDDAIWHDEWIWTEEVVSYLFPLTRYGTVPLNTTMRWNDTKIWNDGKYWTES